MDSILSAFVLLFIVVDPIGDAALFAGLTLEESRRHRRRMAVQAIAVAAVILVLFYLLGDKLLALLGIGIPAFRITGGILLFLLAVDMVFARPSGMRSATKGERIEAAERSDVSVFPMAFPLIAGPGALTTVLLMAAETPPGATVMIPLLIIFSVLSVTLLALLAATYLEHVLGRTGVNVVGRISGLILSALAVQYVIDGIRAVFFT